MSTWNLPIVEINQIFSHPNADRLVIVKVEGYNCIISRPDTLPVRMIFIPPDYEVDTDWPPFSFLKKSSSKRWKRITIQKIRGERSYGLLLPLDSLKTEYAPLHYALELQCVGFNAYNYLIAWIKRYEPQINRSSGDQLSNSCLPDQIYAPKYDLENFSKKYILKQMNNYGHHPMSVELTPKIHGTNSRSFYSSEKKELFAGSRTTWKKSDSFYYQVLLEYGHNKILKKHPDVIFYGEIFGPSIQGQKFSYGLKQNQLGLLWFDAIDGKTGENLTFLFSDLYPDFFVPRLKQNIILIDESDVENLEAEINKLKELPDQFNSFSSPIREGIVSRFYGPDSHLFNLKSISDLYYEAS